MKLIFSYDTEKKSLNAIDEQGNVIDNITNLSISKYMDEYEIYITTSEIENGMNVTETMSCCSSKNIQNSLKSVFANG